MQADGDSSSAHLQTKTHPPTQDGERLTATTSGKRLCHRENRNGVHIPNNCDKSDPPHSEWYFRVAAICDAGDRLLQRLPIHPRQILPCHYRLFAQRRHQALDCGARLDVSGSDDALG